MTDINPSSPSPVSGEGTRSWLDIAIGITFAIGGAGYFQSAQGFALMLPNSAVGPGLMPSICAIVFMIFGTSLAIMGFSGRSATAPADQDQFYGWWPFNLVMIGGLIAVIFAMPYAGFLPTTAVFVFVATLVSGARWWGALLCALILSVGVYFLFSSLLRVPLPAGVLF